nr:hypothetical protein [Tanacetum cinerariifolium]
MCDVHLVNNPTPLEAKDHFEIVINSNDDYSSSDDDSLYYENIENVEALPHDSEFISLEVEKIVILEDEEIEDDNVREKLLKVNLLIAEIKALKDNPTPSSEFSTKSSSTSPTPFLEGTNTFHNSLPKFENFCFDLEEISSGSTTTHSDLSLPEYEAFSFYDDHIEEIRSGSTTTQSDISLEQAANARYWKIPACCDDDDNYSSAITPVLSTEETENSLSMGDEHLDTILATESDEVTKSSVEDLVPIPSESEEISSGSTTTHSDISLPDYEAFSFNNDHIKEISSGGTTTHSDIPLSEYDSFTFDLLNGQCPPTYRSDFTHEEFADELAHIISPPEYDRFYFWNLPDPG